MVLQRTTLKRQALALPAATRAALGGPAGALWLLVTKLQRVSPMFARTLETIQTAKPRRTAYMVGIFAILAIGLAMKTLWFARVGMWHDRKLVDFDVFHIVAQKVWLGGVNQAYHIADFLEIQREASGHRSFMPWTYPPQFDLLLAPLGLMSIGVAYFLFTGATLAFYAATLRAVARDHFVLLLIVLFPALEVTMVCGQNGFFTAGLIGLACLFFEDRPIVAGLALGLMVVKPDLAVAFALYAILKRAWIVVATAAAVVLTSSALCTAVFGAQIWGDFLQSIRDSSIFLERGYYPLFRMISVYAGLRTAGLSSSAAFLGQAITALLALGLVVLAVFRRMPLRPSLGLVAALSLCVSPYAYDYDFPIFGIGLALLLPGLRENAAERERSLIYAAAMVIGAYGSLRSGLLGTSYDGSYLGVLSVGGFVLIALLAIIFLTLSRNNPTLLLGRPRHRRTEWLDLPPAQGYLHTLASASSPSSRGPGHRPLTAVTGVRIP